MSEDSRPVAVYTRLYRQKKVSHKKVNMHLYLFISGLEQEFLNFFPNAHTYHLWQNVVS